MATIKELRNPEYRQRVARSHHLVGSNGAVTVWRVTYEHRPVFWRVSCFRRRRWVHVDYSTVRAALSAAGITDERMVA
jgi:hypothetical protein